MIAEGTDTTLVIGTAAFSIPKTRNIGIIAHIDAGKMSHIPQATILSPY
jgi:hypothetical protein